MCEDLDPLGNGGRFFIDGGSCGTAKFANSNYSVLVVVAGLRSRFAFTKT